MNESLNFDYWLLKVDLSKIILRKILIYLKKKVNSSFSFRQ